MPWTDQPGPRPQRSEGELFDAVRRRATAIRRRRRAGLSAGLVGVASVLLAAIVVVAGAGDDHPTELRVVGDGSTTSTPVPSTVTSTVPPSTVPAPPTSQVPATVPPTTPATVRQTPTTVAPTTTLRPTTTSSTVPPPLRQCDPADVVVTATPDRSTYPAGTPVKVLVAGQNRSSQACQPIDPTIEIRDSTGALVFAVAIADAFTFGVPGQPPPSWDPGETHSMTFDVPRTCPDSKPCPAGAYTATATFGPFRSAPAPFTLS